MLKNVFFKLRNACMQNYIVLKIYNLTQIIRIREILVSDKSYFIKFFINLNVLYRTFITKSLYNDYFLCSLSVSL